MNEIREKIAEYSKLLAVRQSVSLTEAEKRAGEFLMAMAIITEERHKLSSKKIEYTTLQTATYAQELQKGTAKTVTENKLQAESTEDYIAVREELERVENDLSYLRAYYDIFHDGHIFYRTMAKGEQV